MSWSIANKMCAHSTDNSKFENGKKHYTSSYAFFAYSFGPAKINNINFSCKFSNSIQKKKISKIREQNQSVRFLFKSNRQEMHRENEQNRQTSCDFYR